MTIGSGEESDEDSGWPSLVGGLDDISSAEDIRKAFEDLEKQEEEVARDIEVVLTERAGLESVLKQLRNQWRPKVEQLKDEADKLSSAVGSTAALADRVSAKVKQLDLAKSRVSECQRRALDLIDLKVCSDGVQRALAEEHYEQAAVHLHRFLAMDESTLKLTASEVFNGSGGGGLPCDPSGLEAAIATLSSAELRVKHLVSEKFDEAVVAEDLASIERFFKLFPLVKMHEYGLEKFTVSYLCVKLADTSKRNLSDAVNTPASDPRANVVFADTLTLLFEGIARIVEIHQPLIETYYGHGQLLTVAAMIQKECDRQAARIADEFRKRRKLPERVAKVREYMHSKPLSVDKRTLDPTNQLDAKELDYVLSELILLEARAELYAKFIRKRVKTDLETATIEEALLKEKAGKLEQLIQTSGLCRLMHELLSEYILLEDFFMSQNVRKAIAQQYSSSSRPLADGSNPQQHQQQPHLSASSSTSALSQLNSSGSATSSSARFPTSSSFASFAAAAAAASEQLHGGQEKLSQELILDTTMLDDIFFVVKKCVQRAINSQVVDGVCAVVNNASSVLEADLCGLLQSQLRMGFPSGYLDLTMNVIQTSFQQGYKVAAAQASGDSDRSKIVFLAALNNADNATDYVSRLISGLKADLNSLVAGKNQHEREKVENCLANLPAITSKLNSLVDQGMQQLRQTVVKPRVKPWIDSFGGAAHDIDEEQFAECEANDPFVHNLILHLDNLLASFKNSLTPNNYDCFVSVLAAEVTTLLEKVVFKSRFSRLGGLLFDRELRSLVSFLSSVTTWSIRDKFARLNQVSTILNLESLSEISDVWSPTATGGTSSSAAKLNVSEVRQVLALRVDFKSEEIRRLRI